MDRSARRDLGILVAEDHFSMRWSLVNMLRRMGYRRIVGVDNGQDAWDCLQAEPFALVIGDWIMPTMSGIDLLKRIRGSEKFKNLPFLMVTGKVDEETVAEAAETEVDAYLTKPFVAETLEEKLNQILERHLCPNQVETLIRLGKTNLEAGAYEAAIREFERARMFAPESGRVLCLLGEALERLDRVSEAEKNYLGH